MFGVSGRKCSAHLNLQLLFFDFKSFRCAYGICALILQDTVQYARQFSEIDGCLSAWESECTACAYSGCKPADICGPFDGSSPRLQSVVVHFALSPSVCRIYA